MNYILSDYIERAMSEAVYEKLADGTYAGRIPACVGVLSFGETLRNCEEDLRSTLEDWILVGLKLGHLLPIVDGMDLNKSPRYEPVETV